MLANTLLKRLQPCQVVWRSSLGRNTYLQDQVLEGEKCTICLRTSVSISPMRYLDSMAGRAGSKMFRSTL